MELFDKKFMYLEWDDVLEGKEVLVGDNWQLMRRQVNDYTVKLRCVEDYSRDSELCPFVDEYGTSWSLVYYDPNYECKRAYAQGKTIQCKSLRIPNDKWEDCVCGPEWADHCEYRVKPEEPEDRYEVLFNKQQRCMVSGHVDNELLDSDNYHKLFVGTDAECCEYIRERIHLNLIMAAYYCDGKQIQYKSKNFSEPWIDCLKEPSWCADVDYRVEPEEPSFRVYKFEGTETRRRMTYKELAKWVAQGNGQVKHRDGNTVFNTFNMYDVRDDDRPCPDHYVVRGWDETEWYEPLIGE